MQYYSFVHLVLSLFLSYIQCISIPFISNVVLVPRYEFNTTIIHNRSIAECLCRAIPSFVAINWYSNKTCEFFATFPITYKYQTMNQTRLYFPQGIFPNRSKCCMPDLNYLFERLKSGTWTWTTIPTPRNLILDNQNRLVTVEMQPPKLHRYYSQNLSLIGRTTLNMSYLMAIGFNNNIYFGGFISGPIVAIDSRNLSVLRYINSPFIRDIRSIMFLNQGRTMVVSCTSNQTLLFFNQIGNISSSNYNFSYYQTVSCPNLHGLTRVNDSYFYGTSWSDNAVYSYKANSNNLTWTETLFINALPLRNTSGGTFVSIDECGRHWFSLETYLVYVFDDQGSFLGNFSLFSGMIMDTLITDNYVMFFSDRNSNYSRIVRIDPHIQC